MQQKNIVLQLAYDGTGYLGWQKTPTGKSIEELLETTLSTILRHPVKLQAASRTDSGVHARGQVVNFFTPNTTHDFARIQRSLNQLLPDDIAVLSVEEAPTFEFHPTLDVQSKEYHYLIARGPYLLPQLRLTHWHYPYELDLEEMRKACSFFIGRHDFKAFCNQRKDLNYEDTIRTLFNVEIEELAHNTLLITLKGDHFLYKMVRNIVGTLVYIGAKKIPLEQLPSIISGKNRVEAGITAPALGLSLHKINY